RQMYDAPEVVSKLREEDKFGETIIIGLGTNGAFTEKQLRVTMDCLEGAEQIVLLNSRVPKPWESVVNETLAKVVSSYPNARLVDWHGISKGHDEYFYQDGVHLKPAGAEAYCKMIVEALSSDPGEEQ
ncbi:MAG: acetyltransferase, partial [Anaerovoracaceae bacterium]